MSPHAAKLVFLLGTISTCASFSPFSSTDTRVLFAKIPTRHTPLLRASDKDVNSQGDELPEASDIDWDAEWKKVQSGQIKPSEPGLSPPTEFEKAAFNAKKAASKVKVPTFSTLKGDWKFWVGLIGIISVATAVLGQVAEESASPLIV